MQQHTTVLNQITKQMINMYDNSSLYLRIHVLYSLCFRENNHLYNCDNAVNCFIQKCTIGYWKNDEQKQHINELYFAISLIAAQ